MKSCTFEMCFEGLKINLDNAVIDNMPKKDKDGNWLPILLKINYSENNLSKDDVLKIISKICYLELSENSLIGNIILTNYPDEWVLHNAWPKSIKISNDTNIRDDYNLEILWTYLDATYSGLDWK